MRQSLSLGTIPTVLNGKAQADQQHSAAGGQMEHDPTATQWPTTRDAYELLADCGTGVSATVYLAHCKQLDVFVAIKALNLEALASPLEDIMREVALMTAYKHPALLPLHCSFVAGQELWMVMPYMEGGSVAHIMRYKYPDGLQEVVIAAVMKDVLTALDYIHKHSGIHRDVKAGNVLVDADGKVALGDFGVSATMERSGEWGGSGFVSRSTFVGTPCWMAPEVLEQTQGYGPAADIWSFGITMLECAHGHAPFAKYPPMKVLLMTLQGPPPQLEAQCGQRHFSRAMREVVALCLQKDPAKRPSATQLLQHRFFRHARDSSCIKRNLVADLPPLPQRVMEIRRGAGAAATRAFENSRRKAASQMLYINDLAQWDFSVLGATTNGDDASSLASEGSGSLCNGVVKPVVSYTTGDICSRIATPPIPSATSSPGPLTAGDDGHFMRSSPLSSSPAPLPAGTSGGGGGGTGGVTRSNSAPSASSSGDVSPMAVTSGARASLLTAKSDTPPSAARRVGRFILMEGRQPLSGPDLSTQPNPSTATSQGGCSSNAIASCASSSNAIASCASSSGGGPSELASSSSGSGPMASWLREGRRQDRQERSPDKSGQQDQSSLAIRALRRLTQRPRSISAPNLRGRKAQPGEQQSNLKQPLPEAREQQHVPTGQQAAGTQHQQQQNVMAMANGSRAASPSASAKLSPRPPSVASPSAGKPPLWRMSLQPQSSGEAVEQQLAALGAQQRREPSPLPPPSPGSKQWQQRQQEVGVRQIGGWQQGQGASAPACGAQGRGASLSSDADAPMTAVGARDQQQGGSAVQGLPSFGEEQWANFKQQCQQGQEEEEGDGELGMEELLPRKPSVHKGRFRIVEHI